MLEKFFKLPSGKTLFSKLNVEFSVKKVIPKNDLKHEGSVIKGQFITDENNGDIEIGYIKYTTAKSYKINENGLNIDQKTIALDEKQRITKEIWIIKKNFIDQNDDSAMSLLKTSYVKMAEVSINNELKISNGVLTYTQGIKDRTIKKAKFIKIFDKHGDAVYVHPNANKNLIKKLID